MEILLYNNLFEQNHKEELKLAEELAKQGKLMLKKYDEFIQNEDEAFKIFGVDSPIDLEDIFQRTKGDLIQDEIFNGGFLRKIVADSDTYLVSALMIGPKDVEKSVKYYSTDYKEIKNVLKRIEEECKDEK